MRDMIGLGVLGAVLLAAATAASADETPARKAGLWESTTTSTDGTVTAKQCVGEGSDAASMAAFGAIKSCYKRSVTKTAEGWATESECALGAVTVKGKGLITGDFETTVRTEYETTVTGVPGQTSATPKKTVIEAKRIGDCEPGQKPGDIIMPDGKVFHMPQGK